MKNHKYHAEQLKAEYDTPWKKILDVYFEDFMAYCWPKHYPEIDWTKGYKMLDKELSKISRNAPVTNRVVDKLIEVNIKNGTEAYVLIHLEVQGNEAADFEDRMFTYRYRLRDLHRKPIASVAILIDTNEQWRPNLFRESLWGSSIEMRFPIIKLIDYKNRIAELKSSSNRFSAVILAQLAALEKQSNDAKLINKINLIKWLYQSGWIREDIITLLNFIDWIFALPASLEDKCQKAIELLEEELHVEYVTSFERHYMKKGMEEGLLRGMEKGIKQGIKKGIEQGIEQGIEKGIEQGIEQGIEKGIEQGIEKGIEQGIEKGIVLGESNIILRLLELKFKHLPDDYRQKINEANADTLLLWGDRILESKNLNDVFKT